MTTLGPPRLDGYAFLRELGRGGFADVYLYEHLDLEREVAVKVLQRRNLSEADHTRFRNEARRMARLANHPGIVQVFDVGLAGDGRPYISMEFCPNGHFADLARMQPLQVDRALQVGIQLAGAVQSAHNAGILHRDLKPANILLTALHEPALTDFGIAGGRDVEEADDVGISIPFAAPEVVNQSSRGDERSDIYSLGATIYSLLAGRSPFSTGQPMSQQDLMDRILRSPLPEIGRPDVPDRFERTLANAMHRDPSQRPATAATFGRALQRVEAELGLPTTRLQVIEPRAARDQRATAPPARPPEPSTDEPGDDPTRQRRLQRIDPDGPSAPPQPGATPPTPSPSPAGASSAPSGQPRLLRPSEAVVPEPPAPSPPSGTSSAPSEARHTGDASGLADHTVGRDATGGVGIPEVAGSPPPTREEQRRRRNRLLASVGGAVVLALLLIFVVLRPGADDETAPTTTQPPDTSGFDPGPPGRPADVALTVDEDAEQVTVSWEPSAEVEGDTYLVTITEGSAEATESSPYRVDDGTTLPLPGTTDVCVEVATVRGGRVSEPSSEVCTP